MGQVITACLSTGLPANELATILSPSMWALWQEFTKDTSVCGSVPMLADHPGCFAVTLPMPS